MQLQAPKTFKYKKHHKKRVSTAGLACLNTQLTVGEFGIKVVEAGRISAKQLEAVRRTARRLLRRSGKLWVRPFPQLSVSAKPLEIRMGKGKGSPAYWTSLVRPGSVVLELSGVSAQFAFKTLEVARRKLPVRSQLIYRSSPKLN